MFGIGGSELLVIMVVALLVLGPKKLPEMARTLGKFMNEFRKVSNDFQRTLNAEIALDEELGKEKTPRPHGATGAASPPREDAPAPVAASAQDAPLEPDARTGPDMAAATPPHTDTPGSEAAPEHSKDSGAA